MEKLSRQRIYESPNKIDEFLLGTGDRGSVPGGTGWQNNTPITKNWVNGDTFKIDWQSTGFMPSVGTGCSAGRPSTCLLYIYISLRYPTNRRMIRFALFYGNTFTKKDRHTARIWIRLSIDTQVRKINRSKSIDKHVGSTVGWRLLWLCSLFPGYWPNSSQIYFISYILSNLL